MRRIIELGWRDVLVVGLGLIVLGWMGFRSPSAFASQAASLAVVSPSTQVVLPELDEFATNVMGDSWDMNQPTDLQFYRAESQLMNSTFTNGIYSAQMKSGQGGERITLLTAGSAGHVALRQGKTGYAFPIDANKYHYLTFRMYSSNTQCNSGLVQWYADDSYSNAAMGLSNSFLVPPSPCINQPAGWYIYTLDLKTIGIQQGSQNWTGTIRELIIHPFAGNGAAGATVKLDWARLTATDPRTARPYTIQWSGDGSGGTVTLYANPGTPTKNADSIVIATGQNARGGTYTFQTGVLPAGDYYIGAENSNGIAWSQAPVTINTPPIPTIAKPSTTSGQEYGATVNNLPWDMTDPRDINYHVPPNLPTSMINETFANGIYSANTTTGDPIMYLGGMDRNPIGTLDPIVDTTKFRYLTYRFYNAGTQDVQNGWVSRFGWWQVNANESGVNEVPVLTRDIMILEGWNTYKIDLWASDIADPAYNQTLTWKNAHPNRLRFDPNELLPGLLPGSIQMDWIKLTAMDAVTHGTQFPIQLSLNKPLAQVPSLTYYYTTDPQQPTQHRAPGQPARPIAAPSGTYKIYLPLVVSNTTTSPSSPNSAVYSWDTSNVTPGAYYVCVIANDGYNTSTFCSEAPVVVQ